jgi:transposase
VLALPLHHAGFDASVLSEFRSRLITGGLETRLLDTLLDILQQKGVLKARGRARTDSTHVLAAVRYLGRLVHCIATMRAALNELAATDPTWLQPLSTPEWVAQYGRRASDYNLPKGKEAKAARASSIGADGVRLLTAIYAPGAPPALRELPQVQVLRAVWLQQFYAPDAQGLVRYREVEDLPPGALLIVSPYDIQARNGSKREERWVGYKVPLTETCDDHSPHLITHVETTTATATDEAALAPIHQALQQRELLPAEHWVDAGYVDSARLVASKEQYGVRLVGPRPADSSWQAQAGAGYAASCFAVDWAAQKVTCPAGQQSRHWIAKHTAYGAEAIHVQFAAATCRACSVRELCTKQSRSGRTMSLNPQKLHIAMVAQRAAQQSAAFKAEYKRRAGVEATLGQGLRVGVTCPPESVPVAM